MPRALICSLADLEKELGHTLLWRHGMERHVTNRMEDARMMAVAAKPDIVVLDRDVPWTARLLAALREDPTTRGLSIVVLARGDFDPSEVALLEAGANAILRLPAGPEWDQRLERLLHVPVRKDARFSVHFAVDAFSPAAPEAVNAMALNLSVRGMLLETAGEVGVGDDLALQFALPGSPDFIRTNGRVVRQAGPGQFGIQFEELEGGAKERIRRFTQGLETA